MALAAPPAPAPTWPALNLRPGARLELVITMDFFRDLVDVRTITLAGQEAQGLILTLSGPPLAPDMVGQEMELSLIIDQRRLGFTVRLMSLLDDGRRILVSLPTGASRELNLRLYHRVAVLPQHGLFLLLQPSTGPVSLLNLSLGGTLIRVKGQPDWERGQEFSFTLLTKDGDRIGGLARLTRLAPAPQSGHTLMALQFRGMPTAETRLLKRLVTRLDRASRPSAMEWGRC